MSPYIMPGLVEYPKLGVTFDIIEEKVCDIYRIPKENLFIRKRYRIIVVPRQMCMYFAIKYIPSESLKTVGIHYGGFDHTTVMHSIKSIKNLIDSDPEIKTRAKIIENHIKKHAPYGLKPLNRLLHNVN